jgi:predicted DNA binding CopG/RHH family protein
MINKTVIKNYKLDKEEKQLLLEVENGEWKSIKNLKSELARYKKIAKNTLNKVKNINLRVSVRTLSKLKNRALEEGIPYQTLASSVLHKFVNQN